MHPSSLLALIATSALASTVQGKCSLADVKEGDGAVIVHDSPTSLLFVGTLNVTGTAYDDQEKSCLFTPKDARGGWKWRLAVLDTPEKLKIVADAYAKKVIKTKLYVGASAPDLPSNTSVCKSTNQSVPYFKWSTGTTVDVNTWCLAIGEPNNCNYYLEKVAVVYTPACLIDYNDAFVTAPLCEYYKEEETSIIVEKRNAGGKIIKAYKNNFYIAGVNATRGSSEDDHEKSCLYTEKDNAAGWKWRLAVLDTPEKMRMIANAYKRKTAVGKMYVGASAPNLPKDTPVCKCTNISVQYFKWTSGTDVASAAWCSAIGEPNNCNWYFEQVAVVYEPGCLIDYNESNLFIPLCEYYREVSNAPSIETEKLAAGAKIVAKVPVR